MISNYLKIAIRNLTRHKAYTAINILGLAIGLACAAVILLYIQYEFSFDRHHENADRIYRLVRRQTNPQGDHVHSSNTMGPLAPALQREYPEVELGVRYINRVLWISNESRGFTHRGIFASPEFLDVFTIPLVRGDSESGLRNPYSAFITQTLAQKLFGNEDPMGKTISVDYKWDWMAGDFEVTGVMEDIPATSNGEFVFEFLTVPVNPDQYIWSEWRPEDDFHPVRSYILLKEGASIDALRQKMPTFVEQYLGLKVAKTDGYVLQPFLDIHLRSVADYGLLQMASTNPYGDIRKCYTLGLIGVLILVIACINFTNLATARSANRAREVGLRKVVGAQRSQLIGQFLGESILFALVAFLIAISVIHLALPGLSSYLGKAFELSSSITLTLLCLGLFTGALAGIYPAFYLSSFRPATVLKGAASSESGRSIFLRGLVLTQFAISIVLIFGTLTAYRQISYIQYMDLGYLKDKRIVIPIFLAEPELQEKYELIKERFGNHPNILGTSAAMYAPGRGNIVDVVDVSTPEGGDQTIQFSYLNLDNDYLDLYGITLVEGRNLRPEDEYQLNLLINETAARILGWSRSTGKTLRLQSGNDYEVIGVVRDFHNRSLHHPRRPLAMSFFPGSFNHLSVQIGHGGMPETMAHLESAWKNFLPDQDFRFYFQNDWVESFYRSELQLRDFYTLFCGLAILVSCLGLLGLISYAAEKRTREIGIRKTLGASVTDLVLLLSKDHLFLVVIANVIAWPTAYYMMTEWLRNFAYRIDLEAVFFLASGSLAFLIAAGTVSYQAYRAATSDPIEALRYE